MDSKGKERGFEGADDDRDTRVVDIVCFTFFVQISKSINRIKKIRLIVKVRV